MKVVTIFADQLYAFAYKIDGSDDFHENEYDRLMELWTDVEYLRDFAKANNVKNINQFVTDRLRDAEIIEDLLDEIENTDKPLSHYFMQLDNQEIGNKLLSKQKGKTSPKDGLRIYAIQIDTNLYVITGGAIKMSQRMEDHPETQKELPKLERARNFLNENGVLDIDSFFEFKTEQDEQ